MEQGAADQGQTEKTPLSTGVKKEELALGGAKLVRVQKRSMLLITKDDDLFAVSNRCPHQENPFGEGALAVTKSGDPILICPLHGWIFSVSSGNSLDRPGVCLKKYPVSVVDGEVMVTI